MLSRMRQNVGQGNPAEEGMRGGHGILGSPLIALQEQHAGWGLRREKEDKEEKARWGYEGEGGG